MAETPVLDVGGLSVRFPTRSGGLTAVDGISFRIDRGECLGLVGESGSGKTMAALSIPRLVPQPGRVECGHVRLSGEDIAGLPERAMRKVRGRRIGMIFQEPMSSLNPTMTIGDQIAEPLILHTEFGMQERGVRVMELLERVRMPDPASVIDAYPHQLSGGMQQRAMIAMALACGPDLLIADEPTTALDVTVQAEILGLINEMRRDLGMAVLFISHNIAVVSAVADRIAVMKDGHIVEDGKAADVVASPTSDYGKALLAAGKKVFFDLKLLDIDNTVEKGVAAIAETGATMLTVHAYPQCMRAAVRGAAGSDLCVLGVSVLTSMDDADLKEAGFARDTAGLVALRAQQARDAGIGPADPELSQCRVKNRGFHASA